MKVRSGTPADISGILTLQKPNLVGNLSEAEREAGFVTTPLTTAQLQHMLKEKGVFVAQNEVKEIIAYVIAGDWHFYRQWEIFQYMISRFPDLSFNGKEITVENSFQYGPICIDKRYRGTGLVKMIFEEMRTELVKRYPIGITFINQANIPSMRAHAKLGWTIVDEFEFGTGHYAGLGFDMERPAL